MESSILFVMFDFFVGTCFITKLGFKVICFCVLWYILAIFFCSHFYQPIQLHFCKISNHQPPEGFFGVIEKNELEDMDQGATGLAYMTSSFGHQRRVFSETKRQQPLKIGGWETTFFFWGFGLFSGGELLVLGKYPKLVMGRKWEQ